jgi:uncharacterized protein YkwD
MSRLLEIILLFCVANYSVEPLILNLHNQERTSHSVSALILDPSLAKSAQAHAEWMAKNHNMQHQSLGKIMQGWRTAGENIAMGQQSEKEVVKSWMNSSGHRANILNRNYTHVGFGIAQSANGNLYWCTVFAGK